MDDPVSIGILEDEPGLREELSQLVAKAEGVQLLWSGASIATGLGFLGQAPDVLLCDLELEDGLAFDLITRFSNETNTRVIVVSVFGDEQSTIRAIEAGAAGYLLKDAPFPEILQGIQAILRGEAPLSAGIAGHLLKKIRKPAANPASDLRLTAREIEVLEQLARGLRYKEVAATLGCSYHTVAQHVRNIYEKLAVTSRSQAIFEAAQAGIISMND